jgi:TRAP-type mannitol/chloroaromatic compound transport system permease small subunit
MKPTWKQAVRFFVTITLLVPYVTLFAYMGWNVVKLSFLPDTDVAQVVTVYGTFLAIIGLIVREIIEKLFNGD